MFSREIKLYSTLLGVLLVGAFLSWKADRAPKKTSQATMVAMLDIAPDELKAIHIDQKKDGKSTRVTFEGKGEERVAWVETVKPAPTPKPTPAASPVPSGSPAAATPAPTPAVAAAPEKQRFPGGDSAVKLVEQFAPMQAIRSLGKLDAKQRVEFELDDPKTLLTVETARRSHTLKIGGTSFGAADYYVEAEDGQVWLVKAATVKPLLNGDGLMERALHELDDKEVAAVTVKAGEREAKFVQQHRRDVKARFWAKPETPEARETQVATWLGKARRIPVLRYPQDLGDVKPDLSLVYADEKGKELGRFEVATREGQPPLVRSDRTRAWAESDKTRVEELLGDVDAILR